VLRGARWLYVILLVIVLDHGMTIIRNNNNIKEKSKRALSVGNVAYTIDVSEERFSEKANY
jgi:hypothetical protein